MSYKVNDKLLSGAAIDTLYSLFLHGPTWDGNVPSKLGRDELVELKLVERGEGYQWLTRAGVSLAILNKLDRKKDIRERKIREQLARLAGLEE